MSEVNAAIGSGFNFSRGSFDGDASHVPAFLNDDNADHPFHNVDYNTMMVC